MASNENTKECPICLQASVRQVRCSNAACAFVVCACSGCDRDQVVAAFVADHEKDCAHGPSVALAARPATFVAPRRAAA